MVEEEATYTVTDYLGYSVNFNIPRKTLAGIMFIRNVDPESLVEDCDKDALRLCYADMIRWFLTGPSKRNNTSDTDNGWSHTGGGYEISTEDRKALAAAANAIYAELEPDTYVGKKVTFTMNSFGVMRGKVVPDKYGFRPLPRIVE